MNSKEHPRGQLGGGAGRGPVLPGARPAKMHGGKLLYAAEIQKRKLYETGKFYIAEMEFAGLMSLRCHRCYTTLDRSSPAGAASRLVRLVAV